MKKVLLVSFILAISYLFSMKTTYEPKSISKQVLNTEEGMYLKQHTEIFPNPVQDYFYIESTDGINIESFVVYDITGRQVKFLSSRMNSSPDIDVSTYSPGIYMLQIASESAIIFKEFIVEKN